MVIQRLQHLAQEPPSIAESSSPDMFIANEVVTNTLLSRSVTPPPTIEEASITEVIETADSQDQPQGEPSHLSRLPVPRLGKVQAPTLPTTRRLAPRLLVRPFFLAQTENLVR